MLQRACSIDVSFEGPGRQNRNLSSIRNIEKRGCSPMLLIDFGRVSFQICEDQSGLTLARFMFCLGKVALIFVISITASWSHARRGKAGHKHLVRADATGCASRRRSGRLNRLPLAVRTRSPSRICEFLDGMGGTGQVGRVSRRERHKSLYRAVWLEMKIRTSVSTPKK